MRPFYILFVAVSFFAACGSDNSKSEANFLFNKDSLMGNWMVINVKAASNNEKYRSRMQSVINPLKDKIELAIFHIQPTGALTIDEGKIKNTEGNFLYNANKQFIIGNVGFTQKKDLPFTITGYHNDSLIIENIIGEDKDQLHIRYTFKKLRSNDSVPDLFDPALNKWREKPLQAESDEAIRLRLKQVLYYYAGYFANISGNKIPFFNIEKILCPILFYSGGLGLKKFHISDEWTKLFYDNRDAEKAHAMLDKAFSHITEYPDKGDNYVQEYIIALKLVADEL
ncbi:MAG TPA: hypothetical protein VF008_18415 [Niastella sp.]